jgi:hypothetical protein
MRAVLFSRSFALPHGRRVAAALKALGVIAVRWLPSSLLHELHAFMVIGSLPLNP